MSAVPPPLELAPATVAGRSDPAATRRVYGAFPTGVVAVAALRDGAPVGLAAGSFTSISLDPPLVSICVQSSSRTWPSLADRPRLGLSVLDAAQHDACRRLAARTGDRFADLAWSAAERGAVLLHGAAAWLECAPHEVRRVGDHELVILEVEAFGARERIGPLVFHGGGFHRTTPLPEPREAV